MTFFEKNDFNIDRRFYFNVSAIAILAMAVFCIGTEYVIASSSKIKTVLVSDISPIAVSPGQINVPLVMFVINSGDSAEKLKKVKVQYVGTEASDVSALYLYRESETSGGTFDSSNDIQIAVDISPNGAGEFDLNNNPDLIMDSGRDYQFYIVADIFDSAILGNVIDVKIIKDKIEFNSGKWPGDSDLLVFNPAGESLIKDAQTITVNTQAPTSAVYNSSFLVEADASSGLEVDIISTGGCSGSGTGSADIVMTSGATDCVVHYNQEGNDFYFSASEITEDISAQKKPITITVDAKSKIYGGADPDLTYQITEGSLIGEDDFTGALVRDTGEYTGSYAILQGDLTLDSNYILTYIGDDLTVEKRDITVTATVDSKVYDGTTSSSVVPAITSGSLVDGDTAVWTQTFDDANVGVGKTITPFGTVSDGNDGNNYLIVFSNNTAGEIIAQQPASIGGGSYVLPEPVLMISNILDITVPEVATETLTLHWNTNFPSSSYVIYSAEGQAHSLNMSDNIGTPPKYGYANTTAEYDINPKVTSHSVTVTGLIPGTIYYFRTVSRGSLAISEEYKTETSAVIEFQPEIIVQDSLAKPEPILQEPDEEVSSEPASVQNQEQTKPSLTNQNILLPEDSSFFAASLNVTANKILGIFNSPLAWIVIVLAVIGYIAYIIFVRRRKAK